MRRRIIHIRMPRLGMDRFLRGRASLRDAPLAVVAPVHGKPVIAGLSRQAALKGVDAGQTLADARALLPSLSAIPADPEADRQFLMALAWQCQRFTPWVGIDRAVDIGSGGLFLDSTGCSHLFGGEKGMIQALMDMLAARSVHARTAMADTPGAAWAWSCASGEAAEPVLPSDAQDQALGPLPVHALRLPAADAAVLERLGIATIGALASISRPALAARFGAEIGRRLDQAMGRTAESIEPLPQYAPVAVYEDFAEPVATREGMIAALEGLLGRLAKRLERDTAGARRLSLALRRMDRSREHAAIGAARPTRDTRHLADLFAPRLERLDPWPGIERMQLEATETEPFEGDTQVLAIAPESRSGFRMDSGPVAPCIPESGVLSALIDRLANRLGTERVVWPTLQEAYLPEEQLRHRRAVEAPDGVPAETDPPLLPDRPVQLFHSAEWVDPVRGSRGTVQDLPTAFAWRGALWHLSRIGDLERIAAPWWRAPETGGEIRDCFRVEDSTGRRLWLTRERSQEKSTHWRVHGLFG